MFLLALPLSQQNARVKCVAYARARAARDEGEETRKMRETERDRERERERERALERERERQSPPSRLLQKRDGRERVAGRGAAGWYEGVARRRGMGNCNEQPDSYK